MVLNNSSSYLKLHSAPSIRSCLSGFPLAAAWLLPYMMQPIEPSNNLSDSVYTCRVLAEATPVFVISYWQASR